MKQERSYEQDLFHTRFHSPLSFDHLSEYIQRDVWPTANSVTR